MRDLEQRIHKLETKLGQLSPQVLAATSKLTTLKESLSLLKRKACQSQ